MFLSSSTNDVELVTAVPTQLGPVSTLRFNVSFTVVDQKKKTKRILEKVHGVVKTGETLAVLGPSGAGKTTLLKILTMDAFGGTAHGIVTLNGETINADIFKEKCAIVNQEDNHWAFLTCRETMDYAAALTMSLGLEERNSSVDMMMRKMGLEVCADTRVGNTFMPGLSGGQKRRLSIGVALLKKPEVIYLDEPTSGLDAASASAIMSFITEITRKERLLSIFTIHQPSSVIYKQFDSLLLLSRGRVAYGGPRMGVEAYLESINYALPVATNPAEYLLDLVNPDFADEATVMAILDMWSESPLFTLQKRTSSQAFQSADRLAASNAEKLRPVAQRARRPGFLSQIGTMFSRHLVITTRDPSLYTGRMAIFVVVTIFFGTIYYKARVRDQAELLNRIWFTLWCYGVPANMGVVATFVYNLEFLAVRREVKNGMLDPTAYLFANTIIQVPMMFMLGLSALGLSFYAIMDFNPEHFVHIWLIYGITMYAFETMAQMLSVAFDSPLLGMLQYVNLWFASFIFNGIFLPVDNIPWPFRIFSYVLPYRYAFRTTIRQEFIDNPEGFYRGAVLCDPITDPVCNRAVGFNRPGWKCGSGAQGLYNCYGAGKGDDNDHEWPCQQQRRDSLSQHSPSTLFKPQRY